MFPGSGTSEVSEGLLLPFFRSLIDTSTHTSPGFGACGIADFAMRPASVDSSGRVPSSRYVSSWAWTASPSAALARCGVGRPMMDWNHHERWQSRNVAICDAEKDLNSRISREVRQGAGWKEPQRASGKPTSEGDGQGRSASP